MTIAETAADRLLFELCRARPVPERAEEAWSAGGPDTLPALDALAVRHGVQGLVYSRLDELLERMEAGSEVHEQVAAGLSRLRRQTAFRDMEQDRVLAGLARAGFHPLVLKGGALRRTVFPPLERTMGDLDILVGRDEVEPALAALTDLGYRSEYPESAHALFMEHHHEEQVAHPRGFLVEVHWGLTRPRDSIRLDPARFRDRALTIERPGSPPVRIPCPEDMLLHTVSQSEQESLRGLRRLVDVDRIARTADLDWDDVRRHAEAAGLHGFLCVALRLANLLLGTEAPGEFLAGGGLSPAARRAVAALDPVRRLTDEPGRLSAIEFHQFRLWCMRPDHRRAWLGRVRAGESDPLHWAWTGEDGPDEEASEGTTGRLFLLKIAACQSILSATVLLRRLRSAGTSDQTFWPAGGFASPPLRPGTAPA